MSYDDDGGGDGNDKEEDTAIETTSWNFSLLDTLS